MSKNDKGALALRFDVDSIRCIEEGIPKLRRLADRRGVRFTFFVNMGHSFNWSHTARHVLRPRRPQEPATTSGNDVTAPLSLPTTRKLGWAGVLRTVAFNPMLGNRYRATFDALHADGHELGLHGGTDHVIWQRALDELSPQELQDLFQPAFETFSQRYGAPDGFASPGFRYNDDVLALLDREGFLYASDFDGEEPVRPTRSGEGKGSDYQHYQIPVNVAGQGKVPVIEQGLARGHDEGAIVDDAVRMIETRSFALMYGHPYVEGVRADLLDRILERVEGAYDVLTVREYLDQWLATKVEQPKTPTA